MSQEAIGYPSQSAVQLNFQNLLFPTDLSSCSDAALPYARAIAQRYNSTIHVLYVAGLEPVRGEWGVQMGSTEHEIAAARRQLDKLTHSEAFSGLQYSHTVETGPVWDAVSKLVDGLHIGLIVLATHGRRGLKQLVIGSVAEQIFRRASCPVMTVGPEVRHEGLAEGRLAAIVYATDFSPASLHALDYALSLARMSKAKLLLLHAISSDRVTGKEVDREIERTKRQLSDLIPKDPELNWDAIVSAGLAADIILNLARDAHADLIVMGAHRGASAAAHAPWAVAHQVVCHAPCPVLTVRG